MKKKIVLLSQLVTLLSIFWICYLLSNIFLNHQTKSSYFYPPTTAKFSIYINGSDLANKAAFTSFIQSKDVEVANLIRNNLRSEDSDKERKLLGVDFFSTVHFFIDEYNGETLSGYIFNVDNTNLWDKHNDAFFGSKSFSQRIEHSGIVLTSSTLSKNKLQTYFRNTKFNKDIESTHNSAPSLKLRYSCKNDLEKTIQGVTSNVRINNRVIFLEGEIILGSNVEISPLAFSLSPNNFHVDSRFVPKLWNDTLMAWAKKYIVEIPPIKALSLNYGGLEIQSTQNGVLPLPNMELILVFKSEFSIQNFIKSTEIIGNIDIQLRTTYFKIGPKTYYLKQLSPTTIYIGTSNEPVIRTKKISSLISMEGAPHYLTDVKGSRFMLALLNMNKEFNQFKKLFSNIEKINGSIKAKSNQPFKYSSTIEYKANANALDELLKFILINSQNNS